MIPSGTAVVPERRRRWVEGLAAASGYAGIAAILLWPLPLRMGALMIGEPFGDPLLNAFILWWDADRLAHGLRGLWQAPFFFPASDTLAWSALRRLSSG